MTITTGRMIPQQCEALCRWFMEQPELTPPPPEFEGCPRGSKRLRVYNYDGVSMSHTNFQSLIDLMVNDRDFHSRRPDYRVPLNFTIESDDDALLAWIKLRFL